MLLHHRVRPELDQRDHQPLGVGSVDLHAGEDGVVGTGGLVEDVVGHG
jgi:hypothetical protein